MDEQLDTIVDLIRILTLSGRVEWTTYATGSYSAVIGDHQVVVDPLTEGDARVLVRNGRRVLHANVANRSSLLAAISSPRNDGQRLDSFITYLQAL